MNSAEVLIKFKGDTKDLDTKTSKAHGSLKGFASGVSSAFKVATAGIVVATTAVGALVKKSVESYAEFEQLEGGLESLFGKGSKEMQTVMKASETAYKDLTLSQNDYLSAFESSYPLVNAGLSENADSIEYTNKALQLSSDLFNTYGGSVEQYQSAINWALKGSFNYVDNLNLGIKGTQEGFVEAANASGILGRNVKSVKELTNDEIIDVIQHYAESYGVWGKTAQEAGTTILGSMNMVKASWGNLLTGLAKGDKDINGLIDNLIQSAMTFMNNIMPVIMTTLQSIANALPQLFTQLGQIIPPLINQLLPPIIQSINILIQAILVALPGLINTLIPLLVSTLISLVKSLSQALPSIIKALLDGVVTICQSLAKEMPSLIPVVIQAVLDSLLMILDNIDLLIDVGIELLMAIIEGLINALPQLIEKGPIIILKLKLATLKAIPKLAQIGPKIISTLVTNIASNFGKITTAGGNLIKRLWNGISNFKGWIVGRVKAIPTAIMNAIKSGLTNIGNIGSNMVKGLWNGMSGLKDWAISKVKGMGKSIIDGLKNALGIHSPSKEFALIGKFSVLGYTEALDDMKKNVQQQILDTFALSPQLTNSSALHYNSNVNVVNNIDVTTDPLGQTVSRIKTFSGGAKNDYNYGMGA